jgi:RimJ/RimL family protein N-acetyltransferase
MQDNDVVTERLRLVELPADVLDALINKDRDAARALSGLPLDLADFAGDEYVLAMRRRQLRTDPTEQPWLLRAMVQLNGGKVVGRIGFHGPPDEDGTVEIGYVVRRTQRRNGYATEAVRGLLEWGARHGATRCLAAISPGNTASLALARRLGFLRIGQQVDEVDGLELVFALDLTTWAEAPAAAAKV